MRSIVFRGDVESGAGREGFAGVGRASLAEIRGDGEGNPGLPCSGVSGKEGEGSGGEALGPEPIGGLWLEVGEGDEVGWSGSDYRFVDRGGWEIGCELGC